MVEEKRSYFLWFIENGSFTFPMEKTLESFYLELVCQSVKFHALWPLLMVINIYKFFRNDFCNCIFLGLRLQTFNFLL